MPVIKSAKKKLRKDRKRETENKKFKKLLQSMIKKAKKENTQKSIDSAIKMADKAAKKKILHKNKAARVKSQLSRLMKKPSSDTPKKKSKT